MSQVKIRLKNMLSRSYPVMIGRGKDATTVTVAARGTFEVDESTFKEAHIQSLLHKRFLREVRRRTMEETPAAPKSLSSLSSSRYNSKKKAKRFEELPPLNISTDDPVLPDAEKDGK